MPNSADPAGNHIIKVRCVCAIAIQLFVMIANADASEKSNWIVDSNIAYISTDVLGKNRKNLIATIAIYFMRDGACNPEFEFSLRKIPQLGQYQSAERLAVPMTLLFDKKTKWPNETVYLEYQNGFAWRAYADLRLLKLLSDSTDLRITPIHDLPATFGFRIHGAAMALKLAKSNCVKLKR